MGEFILKYWLQVLFSLLVGLTAGGYRTIHKEIKEGMAERQALKLGLQALLRDRLIEAYGYYTNTGCLPVHVRDNLLNMYHQYHSLGANGVIDDLMDTLFALPYSGKEV